MPAAEKSYFLKLFFIQIALQPTTTHFSFFNFLEKRNNWCSEFKFLQATPSPQQTSEWMERKICAEKRLHPYLLV